MLMKYNLETGQAMGTRETTMGGGGKSEIGND